MTARPRLIRLLFVIACAAPSRGAGAQMPFDIPMDRMGSGTTWIPDGAPLPSRHFTAGGWSWMVHGFAFAQYNRQGGPRGDSQLGSLNWGMVMASRRVAGGWLQPRVMLSVDPLTATDRGYPLLLQTGETYDGEAIRDRQHPHDAWMEIGLLYEREVSRSVAMSFYASPSGEPALGPVAFMHRPSAMDLPLAPLGHHWQDATHVSFGVLSAGIFGRKWKLEGSVFNGREPDEHRWNLDPITLDSYSGRVTVNPTVNWSFAAGFGFLKSPEAAHANESAHRATASVLHGRPFGSGGQLATTLLWGANKGGGHGDWSQTLLAEASVVADARNTFFVRAESVRKNAEDLVLTAPGSGFDGHDEFDLATFSAGYVRELSPPGRALTLGLGAMGTLNAVPSALEGAYGSRTPTAFVVFLRLRPGRGSAATAGHIH